MFLEFGTTGNEGWKLLLLTTTLMGDDDDPCHGFGQEVFSLEAVYSDYSE